MPNQSTFEEAIDLLSDGVKMFNENDIWLHFSPDVGIWWVDNRTTIDSETGIASVSPIGEFGGYFYYVCPACGYVHAIHKSAVKKRMRCGCSKFYLGKHGEILKRKRQYMILLR